MDGSRMKPTVSIVINNYNYGRFIGDAIRSALSQTYSEVEIIVVDDGSTDESREVIASFGNAIMPCLQANGGQTSALNAGLSASKGDWVCLLDSDDMFLPEKVEKIVALSATYPTAGMIAHDLRYCSEDGQPIEYAQPYVDRERLVDDRSLVRRQGSLSVSLPATSGLCFRREMIERLLPMPTDVRVGTDNYMKWVLLSLAPVLVSPATLAVQRIHGKNLMTTVVEGGGNEARVLFAKNSAVLTYQMKQQHPHLRKLAWKQYGRLLYGLRSAASVESRAIERDIRRNYSAAEYHPESMFYVGAAYAKALAEDMLKKIRTPSKQA